MTRLTVATFCCFAFIITTMMVHEINAFECVLYDNSTRTGTITIKEYIARFGVEEVEGEIIMDPTNSNYTNWRSYPECLDGDLNLGQSNYTVLMVVTKAETLKELPMNSTDPTIREWTDFVKNYNNDTSFCKLTGSFDIACRIAVGSKAFMQSLKDTIYPFFDKYPANYTFNETHVRNSSFFSSWMMENRANSPELNQSIADSFNNFTSHLPFMFGTSAWGWNKLNDFLEDGALVHSPELIPNLLNKGDHDLLWMSTGRLSNHVMKPIHYMKTFRDRKDVNELWNNFVSKFSGTVVETAENVDTYLHHMKNSMDFHHVNNASAYRSIHEYLRQAEHMDFKKSKAFILQHYLKNKTGDGGGLKANLTIPIEDKEENTRQRRTGVNEAVGWQSLADNSNVIYLDRFWDNVNLIGTAGTFFLRLDNQFSTCFHKGGAPWAPKITIICKAPHFVGASRLVRWKTGFDPYQPHCEDYLNPFIWAKMAMYSFTNPVWWLWLQVHTGVATYFGWTVYDLDGTGELPPNLYYCTFSAVSTMILWAVVIIFIVWTFGVSLQVTTDVQQEIFEDEDKDHPMPNIIAQIPKGDIVANVITKPLDIAFGGGDPSQLLNNLISQSSSLIPDSSDNGGSGLSDGLRNRSGGLKATPKAIPKAKIPKMNIPKVKLK